MNTKTMKILNYVLLGIIAAVLIAALFTFSFGAKSKTAAGFSLFGSRYHRVLTDGMSGTYEKSDIIKVDTGFAFRDIKERDVITFRSTENGQTIHVSHRVINISDGADGRTVRTQGDANRSADYPPVQEENYIGKVVGKAGLLSALFRTFSSDIGYFFIVLLPCMACATIEVLALLGAIFAVLNTRNDDIYDKAAAWKQSTHGMPVEKRKAEFEKQFGKHRAILGDEAFVFRDRQAPQNEKVYTLTKNDIVVRPFSCGEYVFMSLETTANRQVFAKHGGKKILQTTVWMPQSNNANDMKDVTVTVVNVDAKLKLKGIFSKG